MIYRVIDDEQAVSQAFAVLAQHWQQGSTDLLKKLSWRGEPGKQCIVWWRENDKIWGYFKPSPKGFYDIFFGISKDSPIESQFVIPKANFSRRYGGVFLSHSSDDIFLGHTGMIGGGVDGVGRHNFLAYCKGKTDIIDIEWPDGKQTEGFVMAAITSPRLPAQVRSFTELVLAFKQAMKKKYG